jgi:hypothetical protein
MGVVDDDVLPPPPQETRRNIEKIRARNFMVVAI